jgi:hypothetical protein
VKTNRCVDCHRAYGKARYQRPDISQAQAEYAKLPEVRDKKAEYMKSYAVKNRQKLSENSRKRNYGLTQEQTDQMLNDQRGSCLICRNELQKFCIDHDHTTGRVRGILCLKCNFMLGLANDNPSLLRNAINYLESNNA